MQFAPNCSQPGYHLTEGSILQFLKAVYCEPVQYPLSVSVAMPTPHTIGTYYGGKNIGRNLACDSTTRVANMRLLAWFFQMNGHRISLAADSNWNAVNRSRLVEWSVLRLDETLLAREIQHLRARRFEYHSGRIIVC